MYVDLFINIIMFIEGKCVVFVQIGLWFQLILSWIVFIVINNVIFVLIFGFYETFDFQDKIIIQLFKNIVNVF